MIFPLQQLTRQEKLVWNEESDGHFREIKKMLGSLPAILQPCWEETFFVNPSVGEEAIGAALLQKDPKTSFMRPVYFASRLMKNTEKAYTPIEQLVLALMFRPYLLPKRFVIIIVEDMFPYALQHMEIFDKIANWVVRLQEFEYTVQVERTTRACLADILTNKCYEKVFNVKRKELPTPPALEVLVNATLMEHTREPRIRQLQALWSYLHWERGSMAAKELF